MKRSRMNVRRSTSSTAAHSRRTFHSPREPSRVICHRHPELQNFPEAQIRAPRMTPCAGRRLSRRPVSGGSRWWRKPDVQRTLNLTKSQVERLDTVFEKDRPERIALRRKIAEMDRLLRRILLRANAEDVTVKRLSEQVEALRAQHNVRRTLMRFALYRRLTAQQRSVLREHRRTENEMRS